VEWAAAGSQAPRWIAGVTALVCAVVAGLLVFYKKGYLDQHDHVAATRDHA